MWRKEREEKENESSRRLFPPLFSLKDLARLAHTDGMVAFLTGAWTGVFVRLGGGAVCVPVFMSVCELLKIFLLSIVVSPCVSSRSVFLLNVSDQSGVHYGARDRATNIFSPFAPAQTVGRLCPPTLHRATMVRIRCSAFFHHSAQSGCGQACRLKEAQCWANSRTTGTCRACACVLSVARLKSGLLRHSPAQETNKAPSHKRRTGTP